LAPLDVAACLAAGGCLPAPPACDPATIGAIGCPRAPADDRLACVTDCRPEEPEPPLAPEPPEPPRAPSPVCPAGWALDGHRCTVPARATCTTGQVQHADAAICTDVGTPCPMGQWPEGQVSSGTGSTIWVSASAEPGGDGASREAPLGQLAEAVDRARPGDTIVLAMGEYAADVVVPDDVTIVGACARATRIVGVSAGQAVRIGEGSAELRDLSVTGPAIGVRVHGTGALALSGVIVEGTAGVGISVAGAVITLSDVVVIGGGRGAIVATDGASITGERVVLRDNLTVGLALADGVRAELDGLAVVRTRSGASGSAHGVRVSTSTATLRTVLLEDAETAELAISERGVVSLDGVIVRSTRSLAGTKVAGIVATSSATLVVRSASFEDVPTPGIFAANADVTLEDVSLRGPAIGSATSGACLSVSGASRLVARRIEAERCVRRGFVLHGPGLGAELEDVVVRETYGREDRADRLPAGIEIVTANVTLTRARLEHNVGTGLFVLGAHDPAGGVVAPTVAISDLEVTSRGSTLEEGNDHAVAVIGASTSLSRLRVVGARFGLQAAQSVLGLFDADFAGVTGTPGAQHPPPVVMIWDRTIADGARLRIDGGATGGLNVAGGSQLKLTDLDVRGTKLWGARSDDRSWLFLERARIHDVDEAGVLVNDATVVASSLVVDGVRGATELERGGLGTKGFARVVLDRFAIRRCEVAGLRVLGEFGDGIVTHLGPGALVGNHVGAEVLYPDFDAAELARGVRFEDNTTDLVIMAD
ncbi:hypothetical protein L6R52_31250, partial [Myxococcota bacterium]|nr:hypothetical protein [Myxococcota bacterium]